MTVNIALSWCEGFVWMADRAGKARWDETAVSGSSRTPSSGGLWAQEGEGPGGVSSGHAGPKVPRVRGVTSRGSEAAGVRGSLSFPPSP